MVLFVKGGGWLASAASNRGKAGQGREAKDQHSPGRDGGSVSLVMTTTHRPFPQPSSYRRSSSAICDQPTFTSLWRLPPSHQTRALAQTATRATGRMSLVCSWQASEPGEKAVGHRLTNANTLCVSNTHPCQPVCHRRQASSLRKRASLPFSRRTTSTWVPTMPRSARCRGG